MPGFDGTGPRGMGPMTGGGRGFCNPSGFGGGYGFGRGYGLGRGYGFGWRMPYFAAGRWPGYGVPYGYPNAGMAYPGAAPYGYGAAPVGAPGADPYAPQMSREQELDFLKNQAEMIRGQLEEVGARIKELEEEK